VSRWSNPRLPQEAINVSDTRPVATFAAMVAGLVAGIAACALVLVLFAQTIAAWLPFSAERAVAARFIAPVVPAAEPQATLQRLAEALVGPQGLPAGVTLQVHYNPLPVANATATLGGNITLYRGLLEAIDSENALAMVLAHEIAHIRHRDPVRSLGRGMALAVVMSAVSAAAGSAMADGLLGSASNLTMLSFSRAQEERADADALAAVAQRYGHVAGADTFFREMQRRYSESGKSDAVPVFLRTHPATGDRLQRMTLLAAERRWPAEGVLTPLPPALQAIRAARASKAAAGD
jgi:predicted Zn-dependent protease